MSLERDELGDVIATVKVPENGQLLITGLVNQCQHTSGAIGWFAELHIGDESLISGPYATQDECTAELEAVMANLREQMLERPGVKLQSSGKRVLPAGGDA